MNRESAEIALIPMALDQTPSLIPCPRKVVREIQSEIGSCLFHNVPNPKSHISRSLSRDQHNPTTDT